ncbi:MAG: tetratricopeptide repeat protein [Caldilineaceae bacterium]|nr:tetratricopeptide repeat protein [Caldilineaceae bacterium]
MTKQADLNSLQVTLLGAPQFRLSDLPLTGFITRKAEALLIYLVVTRRVHMRDALATLFWAEEETNRAKKNLRDILSNLRALVGDYLIITRTTVAFDTACPYWLDIQVLQSALQTLSPLMTVEELQQTLDLYQGEFLEGFYVRGAPNFEEWMLLEREHLYELHMQGLHALVARLMDREDYRAAYVVTQRLLTLEPWHEEIHRQQMFCLAAIGRINEALAQYTTCCQLLADELGLEPMAETTALYEQIRTGSFASKQKPAAAPSTVAAVAKLSPAVVAASGLAPLPPHNLPRQLVPFFGRTFELTTVSTKLQQTDCAWLTLVGVGGVGKTRLALKVGEALLPHFRDGVWFVSLLEVVPGKTLLEQLVAVIGKALQLPLTGAESLAPQLLDYLRDKQLLLILDNFEHLTTKTAINPAEVSPDDTAAAYIYQLLQQTQQVKVLITSRHRLNYQAEHLFVLDGLPLPDQLQGVAADTEASEQPQALLLYDSIALFVQRAAQSVPTFMLDETNAVAIAHICQLVDGLPLAIELAATLVQRYTCAQIATLLETQYAILTTDFHDLAARHRSLQTMLGYSWQLLSAHEKNILMQCAIFHDSFTPLAATILADASPEQLQRLEGKMLLHPLGEKRLTMHRLTRQYALQQLSMVAEQEASARERHCLYFVEFLKEFESQSLFNAQILDTIQEEMGNIYSSWDWALEQGRFGLVRQLLSPLVHVWTLAGSHQETVALLGQAVSLLRQRFVTHLDRTPERQQLFAQLLLEQAYFHLKSARVEGVKPLIQEALQHAEQIGDLTLTATAHLRLGDAAWAQGDYIQHRLAYEQALTLAQREGRQQSEVHCLSNLGMNYDLRGEYQRAIECYEGALRLTRQIGDREKENVIYNNLGVSSALLGDYSKALHYYQETLQLSRQLGDQEGSGFANLNFGLLYNSLGEWEQAKYYGERALKIFRMINEGRLEARTLAQLSFTLYQLGETTSAVNYCQQALQLARRGGYQAVQAEALTVWGGFLVARQQGAQAAQIYSEAYTLWQSLGRTQRALVAQSGLVDSLLLLGNHSGALLTVELILAQLTAAATSIPLPEEPPAEQVLLSCYRILAAHQDPRALPLLQQALQSLQAKAAKLQDEQVRHSFLQRVKIHHELLMLSSRVDLML